MLQAPHTLQRSPILKPEDMLLRIREPLPLLRKPRHKSALHEILNQRAGLIGHVPVFRLHGDRSPQPHDEVVDVWGDAVGPVVAENLVVGGVGKGGRVFEGENCPTVCCGAASGSGVRVWEVPA